MASAYKLEQELSEDEKVFRIIDDVMDSFILESLKLVTGLRESKYKSHPNNLAEDYINLENRSYYLHNIQDHEFIGSKNFIKELIVMINYQLRTLWKFPKVRNRVNLIRVKEVMDS